jgi:plasmid stabilization system protein ParE
MSYRITITQVAERDIRQALTWWRDNRSSEQAERWYNKIYPAIATLSKQPDRCPLAPETDLLPTGLRQLHFGVSRKATHRIVFTIEGQEVKVVRVRHFAQRELALDDLF